MLVVAIYTVAIGGAIFVAYLIVQDVVQMGVRMEQGKNNVETPKTYLLHMLDAAESQITIFDDGDKVNDSLYEDSSIVNAFVQKRQAVPGFAIACYFNNPRQTPFRDALEGQPGVTICTGDGTKREGYEVHYKIIDGGKMGYLSRHEEHSLARRFQFIDCSEVTRWGFPAVSEKHFGKYFRDFDKRCEYALAQASA